MTAGRAAMKVLLCTSQDISRKLVESFHRKKGIELVVATQVTPRDRIYGYESAVDYCAKNKIPCLQPKRIDAEFIEKARAFSPDIIVAAYFPQIFPKALLSIPRLGAVNVHPGNLPLYRGTFAIPWQILNGEKELTTTLHYIDAGIDSGDIIAQKKAPIPPNITGFDLYKKAMHLSADLVIESFDALVAGSLKRRPQSGYGSYYNSLEPHYPIDWNQPRETIQRQVRVHAKPYLPAFTYLFNRCVYVNKVSFLDAPNDSAHGAGLIAKVFPDKRFAVACADGWLRVDEYEVSPKLSDSEIPLHLAEGVRLG